MFGRTDIEKPPCRVAITSGVFFRDFH